MSAFQNLRQNPFTSNYSDRVMDEETHTIAEFNFLPGIYGIILQDRPAPSTIVIVENNTAETPFDEVLTEPTANQYRVSYTRGIIQFNSANNGDSVKVNYSGRGSNVTIELLNELIAELASTFSEINATDSAGILFNSSNGTDIALFGAGAGSNATFYGGVNATGGVGITTTSATTPGIRKTDDTNTGIDWSAADQLDLVTGGSPRFRIESTGQIKAVYESQVGTDYNTTLHNGYLCRAWVNLNGTGTPSIRASGNISSITDHGTGDYSGNFTTSMPDADYAIWGTATPDTGSGGAGYRSIGIGSVVNSDISITTTAFRFQVLSDAANKADGSYALVGVFR